MDVEKHNHSPKAKASLLNYILEQTGPTRNIEDKNFNPQKTIQSGFDPKRFSKPLKMKSTTSTEHEV